MAVDCNPVYGFLPCSDTVLGSIFLILVYGYFILVGANLLSDGAELLLELLDPTLVGGLVLPVIGALPESLIIGVAGLASSATDARDQVAVGIGTLAGSTIMLLTVVWAGGTLAGRCDLNDQGVAVERQLTRRWALRGTGVTTDRQTPVNAAVMVLTIALYFVVQVPAWAGLRSRGVALAGLLSCLATLAAYITYQVLYPQVTKRRLERARLRHWRMHVVRAMAIHTQRYGGLVRDNGDVNVAVLEALFDEFDHDSTGDIDEAEVQALLLGLSISSGDPADLQRDLKYLLQNFDGDGDGLVTKEDFTRTLTGWVFEKAQRMQQQRLTHDALLEMPQLRPRGGGVFQRLSQHADLETGTPPRPASPLLRARRAGSRETGAASEDGEADEATPIAGGQPGSHRRGSGATASPFARGGGAADGEAGTTAASSSPVGVAGAMEDAGDGGDGASDCDTEVGRMTRGQIAWRAARQLLVGGALCAAVSDPLVNSVLDFSKASGIPTFFVSFVVVPFASNASEVVSTLRFAAARRQRNISMMYSQVYGAVTMNNTMVLALFMLIVLIKQVPWRFTSEVIVITVATVAVGVVGSLRTTLRTWWALPVLALYPASLLLVYLTDYVWHLDAPDT